MQQRLDSASTRLEAGLLQTYTCGGTRIPACIRSGRSRNTSLGRRYGIWQRVALLRCICSFGWFISGLSCWGLAFCLVCSHNPTLWSLDSLLDGSFVASTVPANWILDQLCRALLRKDMLRGPATRTWCDGCRCLNEKGEGSNIDRFILVSGLVPGGKTHTTCKAC